MLLFLEVIMKIIKSFLTKNACYTRNQIITPTKIMLHSTACPGVPAKNFVKSWNTAYPNNKAVCVHAFLNPGEVYQTLPWNFRAWHCGGSGNNVAIGFEICEPKDYADGSYFVEAKNTALELCAYLCKEFGLTANDVTSHCEANKKYGSSYASNHSDLDHWWKKYHDYTMDDFRTELSDLLESEENEVRYNKIEEVPGYAKETIKKLCQKGVLKGNGNGLDLSEDMIRMLVILDRENIFGK